MKRIINRIKDMISEHEWLKEKPCAACKHFYPYMGSAGICEAKEGCSANRMKDCCDYCDCGRFKRKRKRYA